MTLEEALENPEIMRIAVQGLIRSGNDTINKIEPVILKVLWVGIQTDYVGTVSDPEFTKRVKLELKRRYSINPTDEEEMNRSIYFALTNLNLEYVKIFDFSPQLPSSLFPKDAFSSEVHLAITTEGIRYYQEFLDRANNQKR